MSTADLSLEQITASMSKADQDEILDHLEAELGGLDELPWDWSWIGRPSQQIPLTDDWSTLLALAGRGFGKTLMGSEWIRQVDDAWLTLRRAPEGTRLRIALLGRTAADVRDTLVQGESGILAVYPPSLRDLVHYIPSRRRVDLPGGGMITCFSADEPDQLRGPQFHIGVADELAAHKQVKGADNLTAWQNLQFAVRLGNCPQIAAMTTPKRVASIKKILKDAKINPRIILRRGKTSDNVHLDPVWFQALLDTYDGTEMGRQELGGEMLGAVVGALVSEDKLNITRVSELPHISGPWLKYVGLDPSTSENFRDEAGIVVVYVPRIAPVSKRHAYVIEDQTDQYTPDQWAEQAVRLAHQHGATIIAEVNQGGAMVKNALAQVAKDMDIPCPPIRETWSSKAKAIRAEPVGIAFARGRVHLVGSEMELLEDELTSWTPTDTYSPNRLDAMVFGVVAGIFDKALVQGAPGSAITRGVSDVQIALPRQVSLPPLRQQTRTATQNAMRRLGRTAV